jgi:acylphosphatase
MMKNLKMTIRGDVQGVGFRDAAYWIARKLYIGGFVMNEPDRTVYIECEGEEDALKEFLAWCKRGPITAKVIEVKAEWAEPHGKFTGFRIA